MNALLVKFFDGNLNRHRAIVFCSPECVAGALEDGHPAPQSVTVGAALAMAIECYGCGFLLDDTDAAREQAAKERR